MNDRSYGHESRYDQPLGEEPHHDRSDDATFRKLKRPNHASKRSKTPERLRGMHRRRRKRIDW